MPYARISRKIRPIAMMAAICRPMPRRGASSVVDSRSGIPEPRAVTGSLLRKVKVPPSIAEGPEGTPSPTPAVRSPVSWLIGLGFVLAALRPVLGLEPRALQLLQPLRLAGRRLPPRARLVPAPGARGRRPARRTGTCRTSTRSTLPDGHAGRARPASLPAPAGDPAAAVRGGLGAGDGPGGDRHRPRGPGRAAWPGGCWAGCGCARPSGR